MKPPIFVVGGGARSNLFKLPPFPVIEGLMKGTHRAIMVLTI